MSLSTGVANNLHQLYMRQFAWTADERLYNDSEYWKDLYDEFNQHKGTLILVRGDCEDISLAWEHTLWKDLDQDPKEIALHLVKVNPWGHHKFDHAIASCQDDHGNTLFFDNRQRSVIMLSDLERSYKFHSHAFYSAPTEWFMTEIG